VASFCFQELWIHVINNDEFVGTLAPGVKDGSPAYSNIFGKSSLFPPSAIDLHQSSFGEQHFPGFFISSTV
jgi:hypothetical protein